MPEATSVILLRERLSRLLDASWGAPALRIATKGEWQEISHPRGFRVDIRLTRAHLEMSDDDLRENVIVPAVNDLRKIVERK